LFGDYTREQLEAELRSTDPKKNSEDYAAIKAALARALPVGPSILGQWQRSQQVRPSHFFTASPSPAYPRHPT